MLHIFPIGHLHGAYQVHTVRNVYIQDSFNFIIERGMEMLTLKDIHFCYQKPIFKNTTMELPSTSFACIQGKSGSGKTTLLKLLIFDLKLDSGEILYNGNEIHSQEDFLFNHISYIDQEGQFFPNMNIYQHFYFYAQLHGITLSKEDVLYYLKEVNLENIEVKKSPSYLSTGQRKRFLIALALMMHKDILLLDEPTSSLDNDNKKILIDLLKKLSQKILVVCTSHDDYLISQADQIYTIRDYQIIKEKETVVKELLLEEQNHKPQKLNYYKYKNLKLKIMFSIIFIIGVITIVMVSFGVSVNVFLNLDVNTSTHINETNGLIFYKVPDARWLDMEEYDFIDNEDIRNIQDVEGIKSVIPYYVVADWRDGEIKTMTVENSSGTKKEISYYWEKMSKYYNKDWYAKIAIFSYDPLQHIQLNGKDIQGTYIDENFADFINEDINKGLKLSLNFEFPYQYFETKTMYTEMNEEVKEIGCLHKASDIEISVDGVLPDNVYNGIDGTAIDSSNFLRIYMPVKEVQSLLKNNAMNQTKHIYDHPMTYLILCEQDNKEDIKLKIEGMNELYRVRYQNLNTYQVVESGHSIHYTTLFIDLILILAVSLLCYYYIRIRKQEIVILKHNGLKNKIKRYYTIDYIYLDTIWFVVSIIALVIYIRWSGFITNWILISGLWVCSTVILIVLFTLVSQLSIRAITHKY